MNYNWLVWSGISFGLCHSVINWLTSSLCRGSSSAHSLGSKRSVNRKWLFLTTLCLSYWAEKGQLCMASFGNMVIWRLRDKFGAHWLISNYSDLIKLHFNEIGYEFSCNCLGFQPKMTIFLKSTLYIVWSLCLWVIILGKNIVMFWLLRLKTHLYENSAV